MCNECGRSVALGSGLLIDRVPSLDDKQTHEEMGKPYPEGGFVCRECEEAINEGGLYESPICNNCGMHLLTVNSNEFQRWRFIPSKGRYEQDGPAEADQMCPACGLDFLGEEPLPEGPGNYVGCK